MRAHKILDKSGGERDLVSVIIPCFNGKQFLAAAIDSALNQKYSPLEVIVVDDGSTDGSDRIIESYGPRITSFRQPNSGLSSARNAGIRRSKGEYLAFLDCDDYWRVDFASKMVGMLERSGAGIAYCGWQNVGLAGPRGYPFIPPDYEADTQKSLLLVANTRWPVHAAMVRRSIVEQVGGFDTRWKSCEDFAFWIRAATSQRLVRVAEVLAFYRHHDGVQMTKNRSLIARNHWLVQRCYLRENPSIREALGTEAVQRITHGSLLDRGYRCFWDRDLEHAHKIFRSVMRTGYGSAKDWKYMLPALLPLSLYRRLIRWFDSSAGRST